MIEAANAGLSTGQVIFPLLNMAVSTLANTVVRNNLGPEAELEVLRHQIDELYVRYLDAYRRQAAGR